MNSVLNLPDRQGIGEGGGGGGGGGGGEIQIIQEL